MSLSQIEEDAAVPELGRIFEEGVNMYAHMLWQNASWRQKRKYMRYALPNEEYRRMFREYHAKAVAKEALVLDVVVELLGESVPLWDIDEDGYSSTQIAGMNLKSVSSFLCSIGKEACRGDLEEFLVGVWDPCSTRAERRSIRSYEGRKELLTLLYALLRQANKEIMILARKYQTDRLRYYTIDAEGDFKLDRSVLETNFLCIRSLLRFVEGEGGHA